jgi:hypothetical protein
MDPSLEDPSSPTTSTSPSPPPGINTGGPENRDEQNDLDNDRPKNTDEEDHGVQTAGIKRK